MTFYICNQQQLRIGLRWIDGIEKVFARRAHPGVVEGYAAASKSTNGV